MLPVEIFVNERKLHTPIFCMNSALNNGNLNQTSLYTYQKDFKQGLGYGNAKQNNNLKNIGMSILPVDRTPVINSQPRFMDNTDITTVNSLTHLHLVGGTYTASVRLRPFDIMPDSPHS